MPSDMSYGPGLAVMKRRGHLQMTMGTVAACMHAHAGCTHILMIIVMGGILLWLGLHSYMHVVEAPSCSTPINCVHACIINYIGMQ